MNRPNPVVDKSFAFAIKIVNVCRTLSSEQKEFVLSKQLLRSGTAVGALIRESQNGESKKDFIHKLAIAQKECDESLYWLDLLLETNYLSKESHLELHGEATELLKLLKSIIISTRKNL
jgi:four helix bundle protein